MIEQFAYAIVYLVVALWLVAAIAAFISHRR